MKANKPVCNPGCIVHRLATHNTCLGCAAVRDSPYVDAGIKKLSISEIKKLYRRNKEDKWCEDEEE